MAFTIIVFILVLSVLVFVHELGHYATARMFGVKAEEFGFGFPPRVFGWKKVNGKRKFFWGSGEHESEDTIWSLNWIPLGGFVKIKGEDGENKDPDSFAAKKPWKRSIILSAGVTMNIILAAICLMLVFTLGSPQVLSNVEEGAKVTDEKMQVMSLVADSPATEAGIELGDAIVALDGLSFNEITEVQDYVASKNGQSVEIEISRYGEPVRLSATPQVLPENETGERAVLGVGIEKTGIVSYPWYKSIWLGMKATYNLFIQIIVAFGTIIKNAIVGQPVGVEVAGPVGIAVMTGKVARMGMNYALQFTALLSINLAIINFLPLPALDGGRVLFILIEKIRRKPVNQKVEQVVHTIGFALLMLLVLIVTGKDIINLFK